MAGFKFHLLVMFIRTFKSEGIDLAMFASRYRQQGLYGRHMVS